MHILHKDAASRHQGRYGPSLNLGLAVPGDFMGVSAKRQRSRSSLALKTLRGADQRS
jgi:hypothetical protein